MAAPPRGAERAFLWLQTGTWATLLPLTIPSIPSPVVLLCPLHHCHPCPGPGLLPLDSVTRCPAVSLLPVVPLTRFPPSGRSVCVPCNGTSLRVNPEALAKPPACLLPTSPRLPAAPTWAFTPAPSAGGQSPCRRAHFWRPRSPPREACLDHRPSLSRDPLLSFEWHSMSPGARAVPGSAHACMMNTSSGSVFTYKMQTTGPGRLLGVVAQRDGALAWPGDGRKALSLREHSPEGHSKMTIDNEMISLCSDTQKNPQMSIVFTSTPDGFT